MPRIDGVVVKQLKVHSDERGWLFEILRSDEEIFRKFGQVYLTSAYPGVVKAWHLHRRQTDFFCCVAGMMELVLCDKREGSPTEGVLEEFFAGDRNPILVVIPPGVLHGFKCISLEPALVINVPTEPFDPSDPDEERLPAHGVVDYDWAREDR